MHDRDRAFHDQRHTWMRHVAIERALSTTLHELAREGVTPIVVKGFVTARTLYKDVSERPIQDVDLRIERRDLSALKRVAKRIGATLDESSRQLGTLGIRVDGHLLEFETTIGPPGLCRMRVADLTRRGSIAKTADGEKYLVPDVVDHALVLVINAFKDKIVFCPTWSLGDLDRVVESADFDVETFVERADDARITTIAWIVADHFATKRGSRAWHSIRMDLEPCPRPVYAALFAKLASSRPSSLGMRVLARAGSDARIDEVLALAAMAYGTAHALAKGHRADAAHSPSDR